ncbi:MAG: sigma-70 family RNA polymerase sigma factor [Verrucomicrobia bacterium]|nr:sigma-70 family RNA polymerase sigma factor [Verrucomicrobiota bacterium]
MTTHHTRQVQADRSHPATSPPPVCFVTTRWSVVLTAGRNDTAPAQEALSHLCETYWYPLYAFVRRRGHSPEEAQDLTQEFFARLLEHNWVGEADRAKGRFRTFLLMALKRFLANEWDRAHRQKRGGHATHLPLDTAVAETRYQTDPASELPADRVYERRWALALLEQTMNRLRAEFNQAGKAAEFERLKVFLTADKAAITCADVARELGMSEGAARVAAHRLRRRFRELFREEVAHTVAAAEDMDEEFHHLLAALAE